MAASKTNEWVFGPTFSGSYNLLATDEGGFILQGNLTLEQLKDLRKAIDRTIKEASK